MGLRSNIRLAITGALLLMLVGTLQGCGDEDPTGPQTLEPQASESGDEGSCFWINGVLTCG